MDSVKGGHALNKALGRLSEEGAFDIGHGYAVEVIRGDEAQEGEWWDSGGHHFRSDLVVHWNATPVPPKS
jgi:hypothetical protein